MSKKLELILQYEKIMSSEVVLNPEQTQNICSHIDHLLIDRLRNAEHLSSTSEYSTQVNMDQEFQQFESTTDKKKNRKKEYKRKKMQKRKEEEESARIKLAIIIKQIYEGSTDFQASKDIIETSLAQLIGGQKFHMFLNEAIKIHVKIMQKKIWDFMQSIIKQNSLQKNSDDQEFYLQMVEYIYSLYCKLRTSSQEIQKIINMFMCINSNSDQHVEDQYGLDRSTFKFMIDSDDTIKNLLKICRRRIIPMHSLQVQHIKQLTQIICKSDLENLYGQDEQTTQKSTSVDEEDEQREGRKRRRKKKLRQSDFNLNIEEVVKRLNDMVIIDQKRNQCDTSQEWANSLKYRFKQN